jgi:PAS domain S-box-containing protein
MPASNPTALAATTGRAATLFGFGLSLVAVALIYFLLAKAGLQLASIHPNITPVWPPTGFALAVVMLWGYRLWPAILAGAFLANLTTAGTAATSLAIALGNTAECLIAAAMINRWSGGTQTFETPAGVLRFAALATAPAPLVSAAVGVGSLAVAGFADWPNFGATFLTWWLGDVAGAIVIAPPIVLWVTGAPSLADRSDWTGTAGICAAAAVVGFIAFGPLIEQAALRGPLGFLAIAPLLLAALHRNPRDTATVAFILAAFAVWGTVMRAATFPEGAVNESFLFLLAFVIGMTVPSLALAADVGIRRRTEQRLTRAYEDLEEHVRQRTDNLAHAVSALQSEVEERRSIEAESSEQRVHLVEAQRLANLGSWSWDIASGRVSWSQQLHEIYGVPPAGFGGGVEDFLSRLHPDDRERVQESITTALQSKQPFQHEERVVRPDGEIRHLQSTGEVIVNERNEVVRMLGVCLDVTDRKAAERALRESEEQYRRLVDSVHDYAIYMLSPDGTVASWNAGAARIKRYTAAEILGRHFSLFYTEEDRARGEPERALKIAATTGRYENEAWRQRKDGSLFWAFVVIDPILDDDGALIGFAKITRDMTERRQAQIALDQAREQLAQSQKMEALGQLTGGIAHDFNNLLMIVSGHAQMLRKGLADEKQVRAVEAIGTAARRGESLTRQLLAFARRQPLSPVATDLRDRVQAVREMLGSSLRGDIELECEMPDGLWPVEVDLSELELALVNVAVNARDAMPEGGTITLSARNVTLELGAVDDRLEGDFVAITMRDTGTGIPRDLLPRVFEPFFTTKAAGKGTGLGLSQVYGFAHQSGGGISIDSEVGRGTGITIYLPRSGRPALTESEAADEPLARGDGTILVVEDNPEVASVSTALLSQLGYRVTAVQGADEALALLSKANFDLVFSDIVMPGSMNGLTLARAIRDRYPSLPVLLTSGYSDVARDAEREFAMLRKPYQVAGLERAVRQAMSGGGRPRGAATRT